MYDLEEYITDWFEPCKLIQHPNWQQTEDEKGDKDGKD